jgi:O-methyltransferase involved in polyketide biosynthesis
MDFSNLHGIERTMLMTLFWRGMESEQPNPILKDEIAARMLPELENEFGHLRRSRDDQLYNVLRTRQFDRWTGGFLVANPKGTVVDLGCGLDARRQRIGGEGARWFGVDLPEVVAFRKKVFADPPGYTLIPSSVLDFGWMDEVDAGRGKPYHFSAQGLLPYLHPEDVHKLVLALWERFPGCELVFDAMSPFMVRLHNLHPWVKKMNVRFYWGLKENDGLEVWADGIHLTGRWMYFDENEPRMKPYRWMKVIPEAAKGNRVLKYKLGGR